MRTFGPIRFENSTVLWWVHEQINMYYNTDAESPVFDDHKNVRAYWKRSENVGVQTFKTELFKAV